MRVLHSAAFLNPTTGILNQMEGERQAALALGGHWEVGLFCPACFECDLPTLVSYRDLGKWPEWLCSIRKVLRWILLRVKYHLWLYSRKDIDVYVLRYGVHDPFQMLFTWLSKKPVYFLHHTLEVPELRQAGRLSAWIRTPLERCLGPLSIKGAQGVIGVTPEIAEYERKRACSRRGISHVYPNGILYGPPVAEDRRAGRQEWIFVASYFYPWHGLDLLLNALRESNHDVVLHVVGKVSDDDRAIALRDKRVVLHGMLSSEEIRDLSGQCCLGLSSFALNRKGMREACTLKVREYLRMGLPVAAGHKEVFPEEFPYFCDSGVNMGALFSFSTGVQDVSRSLVSEAARPYIDKTVLLAGLVRAIASDCGRDSSKDFGLLS